MSRLQEWLDVREIPHDRSVDLITAILKASDPLGALALGEAPAL
jgi:hypothetical protein